MNRVVPMLLVLALSLPAVAQTNIDAGVSVGQQAYESSADDPRVLTGVELLVRRNAVGLQVAMEYADLSFDGTMLATHVDGVPRDRPFRWECGSRSEDPTDAGGKTGQWIEVDVLTAQQPRDLGP